MNGVGEITIRANDDLSAVSVVRGDGVPDVFWSRAVAEWGVSGQRGGRQLAVPLERFLSQLGWVKPACIAHLVDVDLDDRTKELIRKSGGERRILAQLRNDPSRTEDIAARLQGSRYCRELRDFQRRDLAHLLAMPNGANFSVPGAGKTSVTYALYEAEHTSKRVERLLVVAPLSAFEAWVDELKVCFTELPKLHQFGGRHIPTGTEICLVNYQRLSTNYRTLSKWITERPTHVVLDEAHRVKRGWSGEWGRACLSLAFLAERRDILTGTPAPQGFRDLEALFDFTWPGLARSILPAELFARTQPQNVGVAVGSAISPFFVRTTKDDLKLPDVEFHVVNVPLEGLQREIYSALKNEYAGQLSVSRRDRFDFARMGQIVMYLLEAASNPQLLVTGSSDDDPPEFRHPPLSVPPGEHLKELLARYALYETPRKFVELAKMLRLNVEAGRKTLVWTNFVRNISTLERMLKRYEPAVVHGGIPPKLSQPSAPRTREAELYRFRTDPKCKVLLANPAAISEGISLHQDCHDAIYVDRTFNAGQYLQSLDRIHRLGLPQDQLTRFSFLVTADTIDEVVDLRIRVKAVRLGVILSDSAIEQMALPDDEDYGGPLDSSDDVAALFAHLRGVDGAG